MFYVPSLTTYVSVLLSHTVLSELYREKLATEQDLKKMKGEVGYLFGRLVSVQCTKPPEEATKSADVIHLLGHNEEACKLRGW